MKQLNFTTEYASESMSDIPAGYIDKSICACGMTTVALENDKNVVLAVPTIYLALNKADQYPNYRSSNTILPVWGETDSSEIDNYVKNSHIKKIICTYDSLSKVKHLLPECQLIIDESNMLLSTTKQRPAAIEELFNIAYENKDTCSFISATPIPVEYMPSWVSDLDQIKITWSNTAKATPILFERTYPFKSLCDEFLRPLNEKKTLSVSGKSFSKVIVFMNSLTQITKSIKDSGLDKNECGIICGDSLKNDIKIAGINRYRSGTLPKYLFITSSGFCGIDLVDDDAMTIIVSNTGKNWQMIDMLTDLKQAISRQRNKGNPNYGSYIYIFNQSIFEQKEEDLLGIIAEVRRKIELNIPHYRYLKSIKAEASFMCDADFKTYTIFQDGEYKINEQAFNADKYFILETRKQYLKGFDIRSKIGEGISIDQVCASRETSYRDMVDYFKENHVDGEIEWGPYSTRTEWINIITLSFNYYKTVWKDFTHAKMMVEKHTDNLELVRIEMKKEFSVGSTYPRSDVKAILKRVYGMLRIERNPSHWDLQEAFVIKEKKINGERMIEILSKRK